MGQCGDRLPKCVICAGPHKVEDHQCGVVGCHKKPGKICVHVKVQCANCAGSHPADSNRCTQRHRAEMDARKNKTLSKGKVSMVEASPHRNKASSNPDETGPEPDMSASPNPNEASPEPDMSMDLGQETWAENEEGRSSDCDEIPEGTNHSTIS